MVSYENLGDIADGRRLLIGDFRGIGRSQLLFNNASDRNWWIGTFDGGAQEFVWSLAGHTSGFGDLLAGQMFWTGRFSTQQREQVLFYHPGDQNWWLGTYDDRLGRLAWVSAGNTRNFGNLLDGHKFWRGRFTSSAQDQILFYYPGDQNWWMGQWDAATRRLKWFPMGNTRDFGNLLDGHKFWTGRFSQASRDDVLMYYPGDQNWWLASYDGATGKLAWQRISITHDFGNLLDGHKFWAGRFSRPDRTDILFYYPRDQNWWLAPCDTGPTRLSWNRVGITSGFGNLLAGHKFWTGQFASDRDQVLFYYPGDQNWWLSSYDPVAVQFNWTKVSVTSNFGDALAPLTGSFSRTDRTEIMVQDPDRRRWWLGSTNEADNGFGWRLATNTEAPRANAASTALRSKVRELWGRTLPGCTFVVTRDGRPFADGSFGYARRPGADDGELAMTASSLIHVASVTKFIATVAIRRFVEEWNEILARPAKPGEPKFDQTVHAAGTPITIDQPVLPLIQSYLDQGLLAFYGTMFPGPNANAVTLRQVLDHTSGLAHLGPDVSRAAFVADLNGATWNDVAFDPPHDGAQHYDLPKFVAALLKQGATFPLGYNNDAFSVASAVIEATTGMPYPTWLQQHIFIEPRFDDLAPRAVDPVRSARYYGFDGNAFQVGDHHPDYTDSTLADGYYLSAAVFAEWVEALMQKEPVGGRPILQNPEVLITEHVPGGAFFGAAVERYRGFSKNGRIDRGGGGTTNTSVAFMRGYGNERIFVFMGANGSRLGDGRIIGDQVRIDGVAAITEALTRPSGRPNQPPGALGSLRQAAYWNDPTPGATTSIQANIAVSIQPITVGVVTANRTRLLGSGVLAGGKTRNDVVTVELTGCLKAAGAGNHVFRLASDDGAMMWLNGDLVADDSGDHGMRFCESDGIWLDANLWYPLRLRWSNTAWSGDLSLEWRPPGASAFVAVPLFNFAPDA